MDYEFLRDITGVVKVRMSMGHEVVGHWFNEEVKENLALLDEVEHFQAEGCEFESRFPLHTCLFLTSPISPCLTYRDARALPD